MKTALRVTCLVILSLAVIMEASPQEKKDSQPPPNAQRKIISLSLQEAIELALQNNLDVTIERVGPRLADASLLAERSVFEPSLSLSANFLSSSTPLNARQRAASLGLDSLRAEQLQTGLALGGKLPTGLQYRLQADNSGLGDTINRFRDEYSAFAGFTLTQPLLKNAWLDTNLAAIRVARKNRQVAQESVAQRVMLTVTAVQKAYYDLMFAIEDLKVRRESLALAETLVEENKKRMEAGKMARRDVTEAEAAVPPRKEDVLLGEQLVHEQENVLRRLLYADVSETWDATLVPVDAPVVTEVKVDVAESVRTALKNRPDYLQAKLEVERRGLIVRFMHNQLLPQVDLQATYGVNGLDKDFASSYDKAFNFDHPQWSVGFVVTVPLGCKKARADYLAAKLEAERALLALKRVEQTVMVEVDNAVHQVRISCQRIETVRAGRKLAEEKLQDEKKKLEAGTTTSFFVLQAQQDLARARAAELRAIYDYHKSLADLYQAEGTVLQRNRIELKDE